MKKKRCPFCRRGVLERGVKKISFRYRDRARKVRQPGLYCDSCNEGVVGGADIKATEKQLHDFRSSVDGFLSSDDVRRIRKRLKLTQQEAAVLFGGGPNAFSRYERGEIRQTRALDQLLRLLDRYPNYLRELARPKAA